jgi:2-phosphosulfolactate phosphatase
MVIPILTPEAARDRARGFPPGEVLLGGERGGEPIAGFDLGNSPLEYTPDRVAGQVIILTTTNGTRALAKTAGAAATAMAALVNLKAITHWIGDQGLDLTLVCAGEGGDMSLEDTVCAGLIAEKLAEAGLSLDLSAEAAMARSVGRDYQDRLADLRRDSTWARRLAQDGREKDLATCLVLDAWSLVPVFRNGVLTAG